jgi:alkylation response protein AidB-like acyl-CoA dehydrogenase
VIDDLPDNLGEDERLLVDVLDALAAKHVGPACVEADRSGVLAPRLTGMLADQGLLHAGSTEAGEDAVRPLLDLLVVERLARVGAAAAALVAGGHDAAAAYEGDGRARIAGGSPATLAVGVDGAVVATARGSRWELNGRAERVELPDAALTVVVLADTSEGEAAAFEVARDADGVRWDDAEPTTGMRGLAVAGIELDDCAVADDQRVGGPNGVWAARAHRALSSAALCVGIGAGALALASAYADERRQFGEPLRAFPAVAGMLADGEVRVAAAAALLWSVARTSERRGPGTEAAARGAASTAATAARFATRQAVQVHGGYGYMREQAVERCLRDAISASARGGGSDLIRVDTRRERRLRTGQS